MYTLGKLAYFQSYESKADPTGFYDSGLYQQEEGVNYNKLLKVSFWEVMSQGGTEWEMSSDWM